MPARQLTLLKEFARRNNIGYQVLIKRWLDDRLRSELERMRGSRMQLPLTSDNTGQPLSGSGVDVGIETP